MQEREIISVITSGFVMLFVLMQWHKLRQIPHFKILFSCFTCLFISWMFSVVEDFFWETGLNFFQHFFSGISGVLLALWCRRLSFSKKEFS